MENRKVHFHVCFNEYKYAFLCFVLVTETYIEYFEVLLIEMYISVRGAFVILSEISDLFLKTEIYIASELSITLLTLFCDNNVHFRV